MILSISLLIYSILLYVYSPSVYDYNYCCLITISFIFSALVNIRSTTTDKNYFNFHVLFTISFFFVNFVYPVFIYPLDPEYFPVFRFDFNHNIITEATSLAYIGYCSYALGVSTIKRKSKVTYRVANLPRIISSLQIVLALTFVAMVVSGGPEIFTGIFGSTSVIPSGLLTFFQVILGLTIILFLFHNRNESSKSKLLTKFNKVSLGIIIVYSLIFIISGDRGPVLQIALITIGTFSLFHRKIKLKKLVLIVFSGMIVLTFISYARSSSVYTDESFLTRGSNNFQVTSFVDIGMDLIVNNRNLYVGYDYANNYGFNMGKGMFYYLFAPFPFVPSFLTEQLYSSTPGALTSASKITNEANATYGLGTNMIGDQYMEFGIPGVIIFMFLLGFLVRKCQVRVSINNINSIIAYLFLIGISIYLPRTSVLDPIRFIVWGIIVYQIISFNVNQKIKRNIG